jgi:O-antigen biosynthesis protein
MTTAPRFSVLTPVHNPSPDVLRAMIASITSQTCGEWELLLVNDGSIAEIAAICDQLAR